MIEPYQVTEREETKEMGITSTAYNPQTTPGWSYSWRCQQIDTTSDTCSALPSQLPLSLDCTAQMQPFCWQTQPWICRQWKVPGRPLPAKPTMAEPPQTYSCAFVSNQSEESSKPQFQPWAPNAEVWVMTLSWPALAAGLGRRTEDVCALKVPHPPSIWKPGTWPSLRTKELLLYAELCAHLDPWGCFASTWHPITSSQLPTVSSCNSPYSTTSSFFGQISTFLPLLQRLRYNSCPWIPGEKTKKKIARER